MLRALGIHEIIFQDMARFQKMQKQYKRVPLKNLFQISLSPGGSNLYSFDYTRLCPKMQCYELSSLWKCIYY